MEREFVASETGHSSGIVNNSVVMAAAWEDDDALAAELDQEPDVASVEESANHSILKNPEEVSINTVDPFEADDRTAQLPEDLFDEPSAEAIPQLENRLDAVEDAVENEMSRRRQESLDNSSDVIEEAEELDYSADEETIKDETTEDVASDEPTDVEQGQTEQEDSTDSDFNFQLQTPPTPSTEIDSSRFGGDEFAAQELNESQKSCQEELAALKSDRINSVDLSIRVDGVAGEDFPYECELGNEQLEPRVWPEITYTWKASALCHKPLYFEQTQLERYGHTWPRCAQPFMSGAHFFGSVAILPYKMGLETPNECVYALGHYRPGSCAPYYIEALPFTWRAAAFQSFFVTGAHFAVP